MLAPGSTRKLITDNKILQKTSPWHNIQRDGVHRVGKFEEA